VPGFIIIIVLLGLFWLLLIRPQRRKQLEQRQMLESLGVGTEVVTAGGLYGTITRLEDDEVRVEIAEGVEVRLAKRAIAGVIAEEEEEEEEEEELEELEAPEDELEPEEEPKANLPG
jgi:preprotein translocase subunit YajC